MPIEAKAKNAADAIVAALSNLDVSEDQKTQILQIVQKLMVSTVDKATQKHREATVVCCGPEADLAHKIQQEAKRKTDLLISNLMAMR